MVDATANTSSISSSICKDADEPRQQEIGKQEGGIRTSRDVCPSRQDTTVVTEQDDTGTRTTTTTATTSSTATSSATTVSEDEPLSQNELRSGKRQGQEAV